MYLPMLLIFVHSPGLFARPVVIQRVSAFERAACAFQPGSNRSNCTACSTKLMLVAVACQLTDLVQNSGCKFKNLVWVWTAKPTISGCLNCTSSFIQPVSLCLDAC